jgi:hypothetical protein
MIITILPKDTPLLRIRAIQDSLEDTGQDYILSHGTYCYVVAPSGRPQEMLQLFNEIKATMGEDLSFVDILP